MARRPRALTAKTPMPAVEPPVGRCADDASDAVKDDSLTYLLHRPGLPDRRVTFDRTQVLVNGEWLVRSMVAPS